MNHEILALLCMSYHSIAGRSIPPQVACIQKHKQWWHVIILWIYTARCFSALLFSHFFSSTATTWSSLVVRWTIAKLHLPPSLCRRVHFTFCLAALLLFGRAQSCLHVDFMMCGIVFPSRLKRGGTAQLVPVLAVAWHVRKVYIITVILFEWPQIMQNQCFFANIHVVSHTFSI